MEMLIEVVAGPEGESAMRRIRREVFEDEMGIALAPPEVSERNAVAHLLARAGTRREPVGTLSVIDTSGDVQLHAAHGLGFGPWARAARFTHLAVLKPFRGRNLPLMMMLEAHRLFVAPRRFDYTWLLFDAERAPDSFLSRLLGFTPKDAVFVSEYGRRCALVRDERAGEAARAIRRAERCLQQLRGDGAPAAATHAPAAYVVT
jgi:hypothetical protein